MRRKLGKSDENSGHFHFGNNHSQMLTYYQIPTVISKMEFVRCNRNYWLSLDKWLVD